MYILTPTYCVSKKILLRGRQPEPSDRETAGTTKYLAPPRSGFGLRRDEQFIAGLYQLFMAGGGTFRVLQKVLRRRQSLHKKSPCADSAEANSERNLRSPLKALHRGPRLAGAQILRLSHWCHPPLPGTACRQLARRRAPSKPDFSIRGQSPSLKRKRASLASGYSSILLKFNIRILEGQTKPADFPPFSTRNPQRRAEANNCNLRSARPLRAGKAALLNSMSLSTGPYRDTPTLLRFEPYFLARPKTCR